jgi:hypothetical protein
VVLLARQAGAAAFYIQEQSVAGTGPTSRLGILRPPFRGPTRDAGGGG